MIVRTGRRDPTFGELCWQIFTSLTYGAKGVLYYTYWFYPGMKCDTYPNLSCFSVSRQPASNDAGKAAP